MNNAEKTETQKVSLLKMFLPPLTLLKDNFKKYLIIAGILALVLSIIDFVTGNEAACINAQYSKKHCFNNSTLFFMTKIFKFYLSCMFIRIWGQYVLTKNDCDYKKIFIPCLNDFKIMGLILIYFASFLAALGSGYALHVRVPNPNWIYELTVFTLFLLLFFVPIFMVRFYSYISFVSEKIKLPSLKMMWVRTKENTVSLFMTFMLFLFFCLFLNFNFIRVLALNELNNYIIIAFLSEYLSNMLYILYLVVFCNFCYMQKDIFFKGAEND